jgi:hypothetical protein
MFVVRLSKLRRPQLSPGSSRAAPPWSAVRSMSYTPISGVRSAQAILDVAKLCVSIDSPNCSFSSLFIFYVRNFGSTITFGLRFIKQASNPYDKKNVLPCVMHAIIGHSTPASTFIIPRPSFSAAIAQHLHCGRFRVFDHCAGSGASTSMRMFLSEPIEIRGQMQMPVACCVKLGAVECEETAVAALRGSMMFPHSTQSCALFREVHFRAYHVCHHLFLPTVHLSVSFYFILS